MAIAFVQDDALVDASADSNIATVFGSNNTASNLLVAMVVWSSASDLTPTAADTQGNTWSEIGTHFYITAGGALAGMAMFYAPNCNAGANTVTITLASGATFRELLISEYSGAATTSPLDVTSENPDGVSGSGTDNATSTAAAVSVDNSLLVGFISSVSGMGTAAAGTNYTERIDMTGGGGGFSQYEDRILATAASTPALWTVSGVGGRYNAKLAVFKPQVAASTTKKVPQFLLVGMGA